MSEKIKVLFIGKLPPPSTGEGNVILTYFQILPELGFELRLLDTGIRNYKEKANTISIYNLIRFLVHAVKLVHIIFTWKPEIVNVNVASNYAAFKACSLLFLSKIFGKKTVAHFHAGWMINDYLKYNKIRKKAYKKFFEIPDLWVLPSGYFIKVFENLAISKNKIRIVPNSIKKGLFDRYYDSHKSYGVKVFIFVGSIIHRKGLDIIADVFEKLLKEGEKFRLKIVGISANQTEEETKIIALLKTKLNNKVLYLYPACEGEEYINVLKSGHYFILPSRAENLPIALLETMKLGLIPIVSRVGAIPLIIKDNENGLLVDPNLESVYEKIKSVLTSFIDENRIKENIIRDINENHSPYLNGKKLASHFMDLLVN